MTNEKPIEPGIGADFRAFRKAMGWSLEKAAAVLGRSVKTIQRYERGDQDIPSCVVYACNYLALAYSEEDKTRRALYRFRRAHCLKGFIG